MKIEIIQKIDDDYYKEFYSEWLNFRSKYKRWEHIIGFVSITTSLIIYLVDYYYRYISIGLLIFGLLMIYEFYSSRRNWLKARSKSKMNDKEVTMIFGEDRVESIGPFTDMSGKWSFFSDAIETNKGLILIPENGISLYLQKKSFKNHSDIKQIVRKIQEN